MNVVENPACIYGGSAGFPATGSLFTVMSSPAEAGGFGVIDFNNILSMTGQRDARMRLSQKRKQLSCQILTALNESMSKQLKLKDMEISNWAN